MDLIEKVQDAVVNAGSSYSEDRLAAYENALKLVMVRVTQFCEYSKNRSIVHLKRVNSMMCELHLKVFI